MIKKITNIVILFTLISAQFASGQTLDLSNYETEDSTKLYAGISFGYMNVRHDNVKYQFSDIFNPKSISKVNGNGFYLGINLKYDISNDWAPNQFLLFGLTLDNSFTKNLDIGGQHPYLIPDDEEPSGWYNGTITTSFESEIYLSYIVATLQYLVKISNSVPLNITMGPTIALLVDNNFKQIYQWEITGNKRDSINKNFKTIIYDNQIQNTKKIIPGIQFGLSYEINIGEKIQVIPEINYHWYLMTIVNNHSWNIANLKAGISFMYVID